jgi:hypothetical protein
MTSSQSTINKSECVALDKCIIVINKVKYNLENRYQFTNIINVILLSRPIRKIHLFRKNK